MSEHVRIAVIGAGFAGLGAAIRLRQSGIDDFVVVERSSDVGGVWRENTYPGCACDVQSHLYSFSFAPNPSWSRSYSPAHEIHEYLRACADRFDVRRFIRFDTSLEHAAWDDAARVWRLTTSRGALTADVIVLASGALNEPSIPDLPGLASFTGKVMHSSRWDHDHPLDGAHIAVIGTGASAIQIVPSIQPRVARLHLFQRTAAWVVSRHDRRITDLERRLFCAFPSLMRLVRMGLYALRDSTVLAFIDARVTRLNQRLALRHLRRKVTDRALRAKLTPDYTIGCKRILVSDDYLPAVTKPNVDVVTAGIREVRARSIVDGAGVERPVDTIVLGTGFTITDQPIAKRVRGRGGVSLQDAWRPSMKAHLGTSVAGFPNLFFLLGPNTGTGHTSVMLMAEAQIEHLLGALRHMEQASIAALEPRAEAQAAFVAEVDAKMRGTVWSTGCASWYLDASGRNSTLWPGSAYAFTRRVRRFDPADYVAVDDIVRAAPPALGDVAAPVPAVAAGAVRDG